VKKSYPYRKNDKYCVDVVGELTGSVKMFDDFNAALIYSRLQEPDYKIVHEKEDE